MNQKPPLFPKSDPNSKSWFRKAVKITLLIGAAIGVLTVAAIVVFILKFLPSPGDIAQSMKTEAPAEEQSSQLSGSSTESEPHAEPTTETSSTDGESPSDQAQETKLKKETFQKVLSFIEEDPRDLRVCQNLGSSPMIQAQRENPSEIQLDAIFDGRDDSFAEAVRFPLRAILQDEHVSSLFREIAQIDQQNLNDENRKSFLQKIGFYSKVAVTMGQLYRRKSEFEALGNRSTHLGLIAKIAILKPDLVRDPVVRKFCDDLQGSITDRATVDILEERKEILNLIRYAGLTPDELDFDPDQYIKLNLKQTEDEFKIELNDRAQPES